VTSSTEVFRRAAAAAVAVVLVDQVTKALALAVARGHESGPIVPVSNSRFLLGVAGASVPAMVSLTAAALAAVGGYALHLARRARVEPWVAGLVVGGAASNVLDRLVFGVVRDFLATPWVVCNVADVAVFAGLVVGARALLLGDTRSADASPRA
jgi:signal peptidase II